MDRSQGQQPAQQQPVRQQPAQQQPAQQMATPPGPSSHLTPPNPLSGPTAELHSNPSPAIATQERNALTPADAHARLLSNPEDFLKRFPIKMFGTGANTPSGESHYAIVNRDPRPLEVSKRPSSVFGKVILHDTESFDIKPASLLGPNDHGHQFQAHSIHMDEGAAAMNPYRLDANGPSIMVTGELSGCSIVMRPVQGGGVDIAHVKPRPTQAGQNGGPSTPAQTGQELYDELKGTHSDAKIYGASGTSGQYDSADRRVSLIGVRTHGQWSLFAQKVNSTDRRIRSVHQIFP